MSRIYEALKKAGAERERIGSAATQADSVATQAGLSDEVTGQASEIISMYRWDGASPTLDSLRPDELRQRCTKPSASPTLDSLRPDELRQRCTKPSASPTLDSLRPDELRLRCTKPIWDLDAKSMVFCSEQSFSLCAEQFRTLRSRLYRIREERPIHTLLVTSTAPSEGKTFVTLNLGQAIACQYERRVLLIDADLRASRLHVPLGAPSSPGLADFLRGEVDEYSIIQSNAQSNLFFIPAGRPVPNPAELLSNGRLKEFLARLGPVFDWVILDAPPVLPVTDASVIAGLCDGVLFVVRAGSTAFDLADMACREFRDKNLLGIVLNDVEERVAAAYGAYPYYGGNGTGKR